MSTSQRTLQEITTTLAGDEVLSRAKSFFSNRPSLYSTFLDMEGPGFCTFRGQGGEEIVIGVAAAAGGRTRVTGSSYLFDMQVSRFFTTFESDTIV
jgi:tryptophanase